MKPVEDIWNGLYGESWKGLIHDDAFAHPAKFSRALIRKIYDHVITEGWANKGDSVVDPFGGVALGAHDAMRHGLNWYGCELESRFALLGAQNIALWNDRFSRMPNWGTAGLLQGDSRKLVDVLSSAECCVSSPPYAGNEKSDYLMSDDGKTRRRDEKRGFRQGHGCFRGSEGAYGSSEGQLGAMKEGDLNLAITSPPYANDTVNDRNGIDLSKVKKPGGHNSQSRKMANYGEASGQLGAMPEGQLCVSSPPFLEGRTSDRKQSNVVTDKRVGGATEHRKTAYGDVDGQLGKMADGRFDCAVSSPPYEHDSEPHGDLRPSSDRQAAVFVERDYGATDGNLSQAPETFWSASRLILEQLHQVIVPGGYAVFVVKAFVRDKKIVDFPGQWAQLCEAVGFKLLHHHRASLVEYSGTQGGFHEDKEIRVERKSFFRRLAESKGSPRIDHESVLCFERE